MYFVFQELLYELQLVAVLKDEHEKAMYEKNINDALDSYMRHEAIRDEIVKKVNKEIEAEQTKITETPKLPFVSNPNLNNEYADAFRLGNMEEANATMEKIRELDRTNTAISKQNKEIARKNYEAKRDIRIAKANVLSRLTVEERSIYENRLEQPMTLSQVNIVEIDVDNFKGPIVINSDYAFGT